MFLFFLLGLSLSAKAEKEQDEYQQLVREVRKLTKEVRYLKNLLHQIQGVQLLSSNHQNYRNAKPPIGGGGSHFPPDFSDKDDSSSGDDWFDFGSDFLPGHDFPPGYDFGLDFDIDDLLSYYKQKKTRSNIAKPQIYPGRPAITTPDKDQDKDSDKEEEKPRYPGLDLDFPFWFNRNHK